MFSSNLRLLIPIGVAASTFDGVMLRTITIFGVTPRIPLWLAFVIGLTVMTVAYLGEVAIVRRQSRDHPTGDADRAISDGPEPEDVEYRVAKWSWR